MQVFFSNNIEGEDIRLSEEESAHCVRVLRLSEGAIVHIIDGRGGFFEAVIEKANPRSCILRKISVLPASPGRNFNIHIAISPTKSIDRFEWFVEKATEIGIDTITPILCARSERKILKTDRLERLIISTMKQAIIPFRPVLNELMDFKSFINSKAGFHTDRFIAHCDDTEKVLLERAVLRGSEVVILIGPEGDFSGEEIALSKQAEFASVSLGTNRLRTETAGIVACNMINIIDRNQRK